MHKGAGRATVEYALCVLFKRITGANLMRAGRVAAALTLLTVVASGEETGQNVSGMPLRAAYLRCYVN